MVLKSALPLPIKPQRKHLTTNTHLLKPTFPNFFLGTTLPPENIGNSPPPPFTTTSRRKSSLCQEDAVAIFSRCNKGMVLF